jgi:hypothetical protein
MAALFKTPACGGWCTVRRCALFAPGANPFIIYSLLVRKGGFEPPQSCDRQPLKLVRLPVPPLPRASKRGLCRLLELPISPAVRVPVVPELIVPELIAPEPGPPSLRVLACWRALSALAAPVCR